MSRRELSGDAGAERAPFWQEQWLRNCHGFRVEVIGLDSRWKIGSVRSVRLGSSGEPEALEVRRGLLSRDSLEIAVEQVEEIVPEERRIALRRSFQ